MSLDDEEKLISYLLVGFGFFTCLNEVATVRIFVEAVISRVKNRSTNVIDRNHMSFFIYGHTEL